MSPWAVLANEEKFGRKVSKNDELHRSRIDFLLNIHTNKHFFLMIFMREG